MGVGEAKQDSKMLDAAQEQLATIAGQKPNVRRARKSIANFKLREGMPVGVAVTLRGERAYEFLDRLMSIAIPRIRDFRGLNPRSFDGRGNYSMGVREQIIFPEIDYDAIDQVRGLDVTITTTAQTDEEAFALLEAFGMPFSREGRPGGARRPEAASRPRRSSAPRGGAREGRGRAGRARAAQGGEPRGLRQAVSASPRRAPRGAEGEARARRRPGSPEHQELGGLTWPRPHSACARQRPAKYKTRGYTRCRRCGRARAVYRKFGVCRICLRELAHNGYIPGMTKSSW